MAALITAIGTFATSVSTAIAGMSALAQIGIRLLVSVAASALLQALAPKPRSPGIKTEVTQNGGTNPLAFVLMTYATAGSRVCPPMSHGHVDKTPNAYLTEVISVGDIPGQQLTRLIINDEYVTIGTTAHADYGLPVLGDYDGYCWIKYYDGTQTSADPTLLTKYSAYPQRPWASDMIGRGTCYAIITCRFKRKVWNSTPRFRFEMGGIPLYDPRKDSSVGGSGSHRWTNRATWEPTVNPGVGIYNILRGIALLDGSVWGGGFDTADLPLASWFAGMNECDVTVNNGAGGTEAQYRAGFEVSVDEEPADVIAELLKACSGQMAEVGGLWKIRVGGPGSSVYSITDGDIVTSSGQDMDPFPGFTSSFNGVHAAYPEPAQIWEQKEAPPLYNATWEAEDQGQRLIASLGLPAVPYGAQVRRLSDAYIREERRFRRHGLPLAPDAAILEPLDTLSWTSTTNAYSAKTFEISEISDDLMTCRQEVALRERSSADYVSSNLAPPPVISVTSVVPATQVVPSFAVSGTSIPDAAGTNRRPALGLTWEPDLDDVLGIQWELRVQATGVVIARGSTHDVAAGALTLTEGVLGATAYEVRVYPVVDRAADWTSWVAATTPDLLITRPDLADGSVSDQFQLYLPGPYNRNAVSNDDTLGTLNIGEVPPGNGYRRFSSCWIRAGDLVPAAEVNLESRKREEGGAWSSWTTVETYSMAAGATTYDQQTGQGGLAGAYTEFEYRVKLIQKPGSGSLEFLRDIWLTLTKVTK